VEQAEYVAFIARAQEATSVAELRGVAAAVRAAHPGDPDAERVADVCQMYAVDAVARMGRRRTAPRPAPAPRADYTERAYR
jgi:hypothetical protein